MYLSGLPGVRPIILDTVISYYHRLMLSILSYRQVTSMEAIVILINWSCSIGFGQINTVGKCLSRRGGVLKSSPESFVTDYMQVMLPVEWLSGTWLENSFKLLLG